MNHSSHRSTLLSSYQWCCRHLVQTFEQSMCKTSIPSKTALQEFLLQYRHTPLSSGYSPCELLHGRQIQSKLDALFPLPPHVAQGKQARDATKDQLQEKSHLISKVTYLYSVGTPRYAMYYGPIVPTSYNLREKRVLNVFDTHSERVCSNH